MKIPMLDLVRQYESIREEIDAAILEVVRSGKYVLGPYVQEFEEQAAEYCGCKHAIGVASGTDALLLSLKALGIGPGDGVILPSFTFFATAGVIHNVGATPVFCDIDPKTFNLDPGHVRSILEDAARGRWPVARGKGRGDSSTSYKPQAVDSIPRIKAIIPVHLYGQIADMNEILAIAAEHDLAVVEDAAQAIGARYWGNPEHVARGTWPVEGDAESSTPQVSSRPQTTGDKPQASSHPQAIGHSPRARGTVSRRAGTLGDLGCFSFYPTKNLGAYGDGGMVITDDDALADRVRLLRVHGARPKYFHRMVGINSRLDAIQAAILDVKLGHLDGWSTARMQIAGQYDELLRDVEGIVTPHRAQDRSHIFHQYTIRVLDGKRDTLREHLKNQGIGTMIYYPKPLHLQECFAYLGYREGKLPRVEDAGAEVLSIPIFPELTEAEQEYTTEAIQKFTTRRE